MLAGLFELLFELVPLSRKRGPLVVHAEVQEQQLLLTLENKGKTKIEFAAVECRDSTGNRQFPKSDLAVRTKIHPGRSETLRIAASELTSQNCQSLAVLDATGTSWPVEGFDSTTLDS